MNILTPPTDTRALVWFIVACKLEQWTTRVVRHAYGIPTPRPRPYLVRE